VERPSHELSIILLVEKKKETVFGSDDAVVVVESFHDVLLTSCGEGGSRRSEFCERLVRSSAYEWMMNRRGHIRLFCRSTFIFNGMEERRF
jgi:hypothetical protein